MMRGVFVRRHMFDLAGMLLWYRTVNRRCGVHDPTSIQRELQFTTSHSDLVTGTDPLASSGEPQPGTPDR
jgi:hypothetical protein